MIRILAHRGYLVNTVPENTIPAFKAAIDHGADGIEFDIHLTSDRKFVCYHDDTLEKLGRKESIKDLTEEELTTIVLKEGIYIPTLNEVIELFGNKTILNIEVKFQTDGSKELVDIIEQYSLKRDPSSLIISSFNHKPLQDIKSINPDIPTALLFHFARGQLRIAKSLKCDAIHPFYNTVPKNHAFITPFLSTILLKLYTHKIFQQAKKQGFLINPYVVNDEKFIHNAIKNKVDGIITDEVELAFKIRNELKSN